MQGIMMDPNFVAQLADFLEQAASILENVAQQLPASNETDTTNEQQPATPPQETPEIPPEAREAVAELQELLGDDGVEAILNGGIPALLQGKKLAEALAQQKNNNGPSFDEALGKLFDDAGFTF